MLLVKDKYRTFGRTIQNADCAFVMIPVCDAGKTTLENMQRMDHVAAASRASGCGTIGIEGRWTGSEDRVYFVLSLGGESHVVGLGRELLREGKPAEPWFLFRRSNKSELVMEGPDRIRQVCTLTDKGFMLPDGRIFEFLKAYTPAQNATQYGHSKGSDVGEHLCNRDECHIALE